MCSALRAPANPRVPVGKVGPHTGARGATTRLRYPRGTRKPLMWVESKNIRPTQHSEIKKVFVVNTSGRSDVWDLAGPFYVRTLSRLPTVERPLDPLAAGNLDPDPPARIEDDHCTPKRCFGQAIVRPALTHSPFTTPRMQRRPQ